MTWGPLIREIVAAATDLAEVIGGAIALHILFGIPLLAGGVIVGVVSVVLLWALRTRGERIKDKTDEQRAEIRLPSEDNGLAMVFLTFERVSYALILQAQRGVVVGDRLVNPE